jgi:hypothetical protein
MDKESPDYRNVDIKIKRCRDALTELSPIIHEVEGEFDRVGRTSSLILHHDPNLTHLSSTL